MLTKTIFYCRLREQINLKEKSFNQVERELGYPRNSLHNYKNGRAPSGLRLVELADYFRVSPSYLVGKTQEDETELLKDGFQSLDFEEKWELYSICQSWAVTQLQREIILEKEKKK